MVALCEQLASSEAGSSAMAYAELLVIYRTVDERQLGLTSPFPSSTTIRRPTMKNTATPKHEMQSCLEACMQCHRICQQTALNHCLEAGGKHVEPEHYRLMLSCAEICQTSANFQLGSSPFSAQLCGVCAEVCQAFAESCKKVGAMDECVAACEHCARTCTEMAHSVH